jgi:hypothetical protein
MAHPLLFPIAFDVQYKCQQSLVNESSHLARRLVHYDALTQSSFGIDAGGSPGFEAALQG